MSVVQMPQRGGFSRRLGAEIKAMMARAGVSQTSLTELLGVNQSAVSKRLRGVTPLDANEIAIIADYFGITVAELVSEAEKPHPDPGGSSITHRYSVFSSGRRESPIRFPIAAKAA